MKNNRKNNEYMKDNKIKTLYLKKSDKKISNIKVANSFFSRFIGLMFKKDTDYPLLFEIPQNINNRHRSSIHSCFMRFDLKLVFIDKNNIIYEISDLKPWRYYAPKKPAKYIIEFDKSGFSDYDLKIGDEIELK